MALISFDNAIEVAISTYLTLPQFLRGGEKYKTEQTEAWLADYRSKLDFIESLLRQRRLSWTVTRDHISWAHLHRNEQYHSGQKGTPEKQVLACIKQAALWIFGLLYDDPEIEERLATALVDSAPSLPQRNGTYDRAIDREYSMVEMGNQVFYPSEIFFNLDYTAYLVEGERLCRRQPDADDEELGV